MFKEIDNYKFSFFFLFFKKKNLNKGLKFYQIKIGC
jgi:hypothetical protein